LALASLPEAFSGNKTKHT